MARSNFKKTTLLLTKSEVALQVDLGTQELYGRDGTHFIDGIEAMSIHDLLGTSRACYVKSVPAGSMAVHMIKHWGHLCAALKSDPHFKCRVVETQKHMLYTDAGAVEIQKGSDFETLFIAIADADKVMDYIATVHPRLVGKLRKGWEIRQGKVQETRMVSKWLNMPEHSGAFMH